MATFRGNSASYSSLDYWNLDNLSLRQNARAAGMLLRWTIGDDLGPISGIAFGEDDRLWAIRPQGREIQVLDAFGSISDVPIRWSSAQEIVDIELKTAYGEIYLLDAIGNCILLYEIGSGPLDCHALTRWDLSRYQIDRQSRISIRIDERTEEKYAYVTLPKRS